MALAARHPSPGRRPGGGPSPLIAKATRASTTGVFCDFVMSMESVTNVTDDSNASIEFGTSRLRDYGTTNPWSLQFSLDHGPATIGLGSSFSATVVSDFGWPEEFRSSLLWDFGVPTEFRSPLLCDLSIPAEFNGSRLRDFVVSLATGTLTSIDGTVPLEFRLPIQINATAPVNFLAPYISDTNVPTQFLPTVIRGDQSVFEDLRSVPLDTGNSVEWRSVPLADSNTPTFFESPVTRDTAALDYWLSTLLRDDATSTNVAATGQTDSASPVVWTTISFTILPATAAWVASAISDTTALSEWLTSQSRDYVVSLHSSLTAAIAPILSVEWLGTATIIGNITAGIEYRSGLSADVTPGTVWQIISQADVVSWADWVTTLIAVDYAVAFSWGSSVAAEKESPADWSAPAIVDIAISFESTGILAPINSDADVSLEFRSETFADIAVAGIDWQPTFATRYMKGATLELPNTSERKPVAEGSGTRGATLER